MVPNIVCFCLLTGKWALFALRSKLHNNQIRKMSFGKRWSNLNPYELHKTLINNYILTSKNKTSLLKRDTSKDKRDIDVIKENHQFLWEEKEGESLTWEEQLAKKYYDKLYKEYCVGDLSRYKENKIGLRWRTEQEVITGKGQFNCGSKHCSKREDLKTWEVNFGYIEHGIKKNALVKIRLCPDCSRKLNYHHQKKEVKRLKHNRLKHSDSESSKKKDDKESSRSEEVIQVTEEEEKIEKESQVWSQSHVEEETESKTREEEFDEYLDQLFL